MDSRIKQLLRQIAENPGNVTVIGGNHEDCDVEEDIEHLTQKIAGVPAADAPLDQIVAYGIERVATLARMLSKEGRAKELEHDLEMARKPDDLDLDADEHRHTRLHFERDKLSAQGMRKEGAALSRFLEVIRGSFQPPRDGDKDS